MDLHPYNMQKREIYAKMMESTLSKSMLKVTLSPDQIDLITYCLEQQEYDFDEIETRDYREIIKAIKFPEPAN